MTPPTIGTLVKIKRQSLFASIWTHMDTAHAMAPETLVLVLEHDKKYELTKILWNELPGYMCTGDLVEP